MKHLVSVILVTLLFAVISLFVGVSSISPLAVLSGQTDDRTLMILAASRLPRTIALILAGA